MLQEKHFTLIRILNFIYVVWFISSFISFVAVRPLGLVDGTQIGTVSAFLSSVYNFSALACMHAPKQNPL